MSLIKRLQNQLFGNVRKQRGVVLKDTKVLHSTRSGVYKTERKRLHQSIISQLLKNTGKESKNQYSYAFFFGGGSGSGKTTLKMKMLKEHDLLKSINVVNVDPDEIKLYLPEFEIYKQLSPEKAAFLVHKESCDIRDLLVEHLIRAKINFIYESTMAKPKKYKRLFTRLHHEGYKVHLFISDLPVSLAKQRSAQRAEQDGRFVPLKIIEDTHKLIPKTFSNIRDLTDSCHIYDSRQGLELIISSTIGNRTFYHEFIKKGF